jgi:hypothetical protein
MKTFLVVAILACAPALFAADTNSPPPSVPSIEPPALRVNLTEQADLVRQIGEEAARGFDPEAHARWLRGQIEALADKPDVAPETVAASKPALELAPKPAGSARETALRDTIAKLRALASQLEAQLSPAQQH